MKIKKQRGKFILVLGGARSGKSSFAEELAKRKGRTVTYIATAQPLDQEMQERIENHRERRPDEWTTIEETHFVGRYLGAVQTDTVLVDCVTLLVSNLLLDDNFPSPNCDYRSQEKQQAVLDEIESLAQQAHDCQAEVIIVTNEVGQGLVPEYALSRVYRDLAGRANQLLAEYADKVYFVAAGIPIELKALGAKVWASIEEDE